MKLTVGLGSVDEYIRFSEAGADEFFCGYVPYSWTQKYDTMMPLNRREVLCSNVQLGAFSELEIPYHGCQDFQLGESTQLYSAPMYSWVLSPSWKSWHP